MDHGKMQNSLTDEMKNNVHAIKRNYEFEWIITNRVYVQDDITTYQKWMDLVAT